MHSFELVLMGIFSHFIGDYILQSDWMAQEKTKRWLPAILHGITYTIPFVFFTSNLLALAIIIGTHILIDRFRIIRYLIWLKNFLSPRSAWLPWQQCTATGYSDLRPAWLTVWLMIIADNVLHIIINSFTLYYLGA